MEGAMMKDCTDDESVNCRCAEVGRRGSGKLAKRGSRGSLAGARRGRWTVDGSLAACSSATPRLFVA